MAESKINVLILGGGFGGIKTALELSGRPAFSITLVSNQDSFRYYPTLYQAATGGKLAASRILLGEIFNNKDVSLIKDTITKLDRKGHKVISKSGKQYPYDILVLALGVVTNYFGIKGLKEYSYGIKSVEEAQELRDHIHKQLMEEGKPDLNYVVIGGGPTGVELAGALPSYIVHVMKRHGLPKKQLHIDLVEAEPRLTPRMPKVYSLALQKRLRRLGVKLYLNQTVQAETADSLMVSGRPIGSRTVVWTAGVINNPFFSTNEFALTDHGKVKVNEFLQAEPDIYVIGDNADTPYSGMAQTALYDAKYLAESLKRQAGGRRIKAYRPKKPVYITTAGPHWAAVLWNKIHIYGWLGWLLRSAADLVAYHDLEPFWKASKHWLAEEQNEEACSVCSPKA